MKANELKIPISSPIGLQLDNLVYNQHGEMVTIRANDFHRWMQPRMSGDYGIYAIPLTPEVLEKCGFEKRIWNNGGLQLKSSIDNWNIEYNLHANASTSFKIMADGGYDEGGEYDLLGKCKYLHQLQNLYFALTGEELIYTP